MESLKIIMSLLFILFGACGIIYSLFTMYQSIGAKQWIKVKANILSSYLDVSYDTEDDCMYEVKIHYSYTYRSRQYFSKKVAYGYMGNSIEYFSKKIAYKYFTDTLATVYVNPKTPKISVLLVGIKPFHLINIIFFIVFTAIAYHAYLNTILSH